MAKEPTTQHQDMEYLLSAIRGDTTKNIRGLGADGPNRAAVLMSMKTEAGWLDRVLRVYLSMGSKDALRVVMTVYDDLFGDCTSKAGQLQTLTALSKRYMTDTNFAWFINSNLKVMDTLIPRNPFLLICELFDVNYAHVPGITAPSDGTASEENRIHQWSILQEEHSLNQNVHASDSALFYLIRRPWLTRYLLSLVLYRLHYDYSWLADEVKKIEIPSDDGEGGKPDPDSLSTDIPFPTVLPPTFAEIGAPSVPLTPIG